MKCQILFSRKNQKKKKKKKQTKKWCICCLLIAPEGTFSNNKVLKLSLLLIRNASIHLVSTHNICFRGEIRKMIYGYPVLSGAMSAEYAQSHAKC